MIKKIKRILRDHALLRLFLILLSAVVGLMVAMYVFENMSIWKSFYFSIITGTTIGYGDISPSTIAGQISVMLFALASITALGEFISMTASASTDLLRRKREGMYTVKEAPDLIIIGYPNQSKVETIVNEFQNDKEHRDDVIVCLNNQIDVQPDWMINKHVFFIKGLASSKEVLERANIYQAKKIIILANDPNSISSDDFTSSAILMCEKLNHKAYTIAERVRDEFDLFDMCDCDHVIPVSNGKELAHEVLNPGAIDLIHNLFSNDTSATQRNLILSEDFDWKSIVITLLGHQATAIGYKNDRASEFNFSPHHSDFLKKGTTVKYISDRYVYL